MGKNRESINAMNKEIASGAFNANKTILEEAKNTVALRKAAEDRAKAAKIMIGVLDEVSKKQSEGIKLDDKAAAAVKIYTDNLAYFKEALKTATDPTQIQVLSKSMERMRDNIVSVYDRATKAITPMNNKLEQAGTLTDKLSDSIMGSFSSEELDVLSNNLNNASNEMEQLGALIDFVSQKMEGLDKESDLFKTLSADIEEANTMLGRTSEVLDISSLSSDQLVDRLKFLQDALQIEANPQEIVKLNKEIEATEVRLKQIKNAGKEGFDEMGNKIIPTVEEKVKSLGAQLEEVVQQMAKMKAEGLGDGKEYDELMVKAVKLKQAISGVKDELKEVASETPTLDGLIGAGTLIASGFNIAQGAVALFGEENENLEKTIAKLTAGISILQGLQQIQIELKNKESVANKALTASQALYNVVVGASTGALKAFRIALAATGIGLIILAVASLIANWDKLTESIKISGPEAEKWGQRIDKIKQVAVGVGNAVLQYLIWPIKTLYVLFTDGANAAVDSFINSMNMVKGYSDGLNWELQRQNEAATKKYLETKLKEKEKAVEILKALGKDTQKEEKEIFNYRVALAKAGSEEEQSILQEVQVWRAQNIKKEEEERKKAADKAAEKRKREEEEAKRKRDKEAKRILDFNRKLIDLEYSKQASIAEAMADGVLKEEEQEKLRYQTAVLALQRELEDFKGTADEKKVLQDSINAQQLTLAQDHDAKMLAIMLKGLKDIEDAQRQSGKIIKEINGQSQQLELDEVEEKYKNLEKVWKKGHNEEKDFSELKNKEIVNINLKYALQDLKDREDIETARISLIKIKGKTEEEQEIIRETFKYQIMLDAANERLDLLRKVGGKENAVAIAQTEALIAELNLKIGKSTTKKKTNVFQLLGFDIKDDEAKEIVDSYRQVFSQITQAWQDALSLQIDAKQRQIDQLNDQISEVERALDKELDLQEQGYANNVSAKQQELDALKAQRDEETRQKEELLKKEQQFAVAQVILNGIVQASELALAAAKIFKANSGIPFGVGVAIAVASIATMLTTFFAVKNQVKAISSDVPKFRKGGSFILNGPSHEQGGLGVYNEKTGQRVAEVEGGEGFFAINKHTRKYLPLLEAINNDDLGRVGSFMENFKADLGEPVFANPQGLNNVFLLSQRKEDRENRYKEAMIQFSDSGELKDIAKSNRMMLEIEKNRKIITETDTHIIEQQGNITRRIKKKK
ncbi:hypothetical protein [Sphingobacterium multivorum]|uniref:hypothetical protein n=1 Tax=Sphingobacterium multivorum TaxID=28454 RepID=UPI0028AEDFE9|nr:hypothetical protein [Sphingobacterium multivorum]